MKTSVPITFVSLLACFFLSSGVAAKPKSEVLFDKTWPKPLSNAIAHDQEERIVGGAVVTPNSIPHMVSVQYKSNPHLHFCGGSIIDSTTVLTAAQCCEDFFAFELRIVAGDHILQIVEGKEVARDISRIIIHDFYDNRELYNDICLLILETPLPMNDDISSVELPTQGQQFSDMAVASGWGATDLDETETEYGLKSVEMPLLSDDYCSSTYGDVNVLTEMSTMLCAGDINNGQADTRFGDRGGPLTCDGARVHCGISSWGFAEVDVKFPGVYTETSAFRDWIDLYSGAYVTEIPSPTEAPNPTDKPSAADGLISNWTLCVLSMISTVIRGRF